MPKTASPLPARFEGFADPDCRFFRSLARNQRREWFEAHRHEYEEGWLRPMQALLAEVRERLDPVFPTLPLAEPKVFRIHRDVRFAKDKSPYKTHIGGYIGIHGDGAGPSAPAPLYLHLGAGERFAVAGQYMMDGDRLARFRAAVLDDRRGEQLAGILQTLSRGGFVVGSHDVLARVPRGIDPSHPRADLLKRKGVMATFPAWPGDLLVDRGLGAWLARQAKRAAPLVEWLASLAD